MRIITEDFSKYGSRNQRFYIQSRLVPKGARRYRRLGIPGLTWKARCQYSTCRPLVARVGLELAG